MILDWAKVRVFVKPGPTDLRKQINGLSVIVAEQLGMDPLDVSLFSISPREVGINLANSNEVSQSSIAPNF